MECGLDKAELKIPCRIDHSLFIIQIRQFVVNKIEIFLCEIVIEKGALRLEKQSFK